MATKRKQKPVQKMIRLTDAQAKALQPLYDLASEASNSGKPGIILAQCDSQRRLRVGFVPHETAKQLAEMFHGDLTKRI